MRENLFFVYKEVMIDICYCSSIFLLATELEKYNEYAISSTKCFSCFFLNVPAVFEI